MRLFRASQGIVDELAEMCAEDSKSISELLRKAQFVSFKLTANKVAEWIENESTGYGIGTVVPRYRNIPCQLKFLNPYQGYCDIVFVGNTPSPLKSIWLSDSAPSLENAISDGDPSGTLMIPCSDKENHYLWEQDTSFRPYYFKNFRTFTPSSVKGILNHVRTRLMQWAIALSNEGIKGEGLTFSKEDLERAVNVTNSVFNTGNMSFVGNTDGRSSVNVNQSSQSRIDGEAVKSFIESYEQVSQALPEPARELISGEVSALKEEVQKPTPDEGRIKKALTTIYKAAGNVGSNIVANGICGQVGPLIGM